MLLRLLALPLALAVLPSSMYAQALTRIANVTTYDVPSGLALSSAGTTAYLTNFATNTLQVYDVSTPAAPVLLNTITPLVLRARDVTVAGNRAYITGFGLTDAGYGDVKAYDISNPVAPVKAGFSYYNIPEGSPITVTANSSLVCVSSITKGTFQVLDIDLNLLSTVKIGDKLSSLTANLNGTTAYVRASNQANTSIYDLSTPKAPVLRGSFNGYIQAVNGSLAFGLSGSTLYVYDISAPTSPVLLGSATTNGGVLLAASGNRVFITGGTDPSAPPLQAFDVSTPAAPRLLATAGTGSSGQRLVCNGRYAYVVKDNSLRVYELTAVTASRGAVSNALTLYPNPARHFVTVSASNSTGPIVLYDITGRICLSVPALTAGNKLDLGNLPAGLYQLRVGNSMRKLQVE
jgi:hypothetical protein